MLLLIFVLPASAYAAGNALTIDMTTKYDGMMKTYANGYTPTVQSDSVNIVLPLLGATYDHKVMATVDLGETTGSPFVYSNYAQTVTGSGAYLFSFNIPLLPDRINGFYPVVLNVNYLNAAGSASSQSFTVYINISDGLSPDVAEQPTINQLNIDGTMLYPGMDKTYAQGYVPKVADGKVTIVLPLKGKTYSGDVNLTADLGTTTGNPFIFGNYSTSVHGDGDYLFTLEIPLSDERINGIYPVTLTVEYLDTVGAKASQVFPVYVTIADGHASVDPEEKVIAEIPQLFISKCHITPDTISGNMEFTAELTVANIGNLSARSVMLAYGSAVNGTTPTDVGILPAEVNSNLLLGTIEKDAEKSVSIKLKTTADVLVGAQFFPIKLDYSDVYGGTYTVTFNYLVEVTQPAEISYDPITIPQSVTSGNSLSLPANVFNVGKSTLRNVTVSLSGAGLFPVSSAFLGDILPGQAGNGAINVMVGMLSMTKGYTEDYGSTDGKYTITYTDDKGEQHTIENDFSTEITKPVDNSEPSENTDLSQEPAFQWWITILVAFAIIAIVISTLVVSRVTRAMKIQTRPNISSKKNGEDKPAL